jgi:hypothetical protein
MNLPRSSFALFVVAASAVAQAQSSEPFPVPFVVEHHAVDGSLGGTPVTGETVRDTYGGSFLVSERVDGARTIVDFARREVTEVRPKEGTYWSLSFGRFADLRRRLEEAESTEAAPKVRAQAAAGRPPVRVETVAESEGSATRGALSTRSGAERHLRASVEGGPSLEVWVDPSSPRLTTGAVAALAEFERSVLGPSDGGVGPADLLEAVRKAEGGALAVRTRRQVGRISASPSDSFLETVVTKAAPVASLPPTLVAVPEGLRRVPCPLEVVVSWAEDEAALRQRGRK